MQYKVSVKRTFSAAHALNNYKGKCENLHGHNWVVRAAVSGKKLNATGMLMDFTDLKAELDKVLSVLDHTHLNAIPPFNKTNPTAEIIAEYIFAKMAPKIPKPLKLEEVEVWESETSSALITKNA